MQIGSSKGATAMSHVREGMRVLDAAGTEIGKVEYIQMGDPDAVTTEGDEQRAIDLLGRVTETSILDESEPDVPGPLRTRLRRTGYLKIDGRGLHGADRYVSSEQVGEVSGDMVRLTARQHNEA